MSDRADAPETRALPGGMCRAKPVDTDKDSAALHLASRVRHIGLLIVCPGWWYWTLATLLGNHLLLLAFGVSPRSKLLGQNLVTLPRHSRENGFVALTFDDGPDPYVTPLVLDLLDVHNAKASFFVIHRPLPAPGFH